MAALESNLDETSESFEQDSGDTITESSETESSILIRSLNQESPKPKDPAIEEILEREIEHDQQSAKAHAERDRMITATDGSIILSHNPFTTPERLLLFKKGQSRPSKTLTMQYGNDMEVYGKLWYINNIERNDERFVNIGLVRSDKYSWLGCSPDGAIIDSNTRVIKRLVEIKTRMFNLPSYYYTKDWIQCQIQMEVTGVRQCHLCYFTFDGNQVTRVRRVLLDRYEDWFKLNVDKLYEFYMKINE
jgi:hypothetical protein